eukprot:comp19786_c0_seq1/m.23726 comp19786_c0_seq1/g.23726  ORF comp19786_c0_seq1/g.23726 comp19786_c0_seq1/m.23726 type:complete len:1927 (-) comp19786_c0_seq1:439-6219(-)
MPGDDDLAILKREKGDVNDAAAQADWAAQKWIWVKDDAEGFLAVNIVEEKGDVVKVKMPNGALAEININDTYKMNPPKFDKAEDMADLAYLNEPAVLDNLRKRYQSNLIYTYSGLFCVVINPYKRLPIYTTEVVNAYKGKRRIELPPHVYNIADTAYRDMLQDRENQSILITGESGAGKTENTKKVIQYLATIAAGSGSGQGTLEQQLLQCNPVLEAFGNAKTIKNDNSSRFGKFIRIEFDRSGYISGGNIETYLLEKSRAVSQGANERNYHIFYQLLKSASPEEKAEYMLDDISEVPYITNPDCSKVDAINDQSEFRDMLKAMEVVGITPNEQKAIFRVLGGIMKSGQMKFVDDRSDQATMPDDSKAAMVCKLFGIQLSDLSKAMLKPRMKVGRDFVTKAQRSDQVVAAVKAICKAIYERLFLWIVEKVNRALDTRRSSNTFIGILDIAGFEIFKVNSFEQLCINYTNEKLQQFFNNHMFVTEQEEYKKEGIEWTFIDFGLDLQPCIDLIEKPMGLLSLLDEECLLLPRSSDQSYCEKLEKQHDGKTPKFAKLGGKIKRDTPGFQVEHYAAPVEYSLDGWLVKNTDPLNDNITELLAKSTDDLMRYIFRDFATEGERSGGRRGGSMRTVGQLYRDQLNSLMNTLRSTSPHFVRCIIPNHEKKPGKITAHLVLDQLRCNGVLEGIRICRKGFPNRIPFQDFKQRYEILAPGAIPRGFMDGRKACEKILEVLQMPADNFRVGSSKIFFRTGVLGQLEEMRDEKLSSIIRNLQAHCQGYLARRSYKRMTNHEVAVKVIQRNCRKYLLLRSWAWWKLFVRVQPLLKVTQEDNLKRELEDSKKRLEECTKKNDDLVKDYESLTQEKNQLKADLDKKQNELFTCNDTIDRMQSRVQQLMKDVQDMEDKLEEEGAKSDSLLTDKKKLMAEKDALCEELSSTKDRAEKLASEKATLEEKLKTTQSELDIEKDSNQKLSKEKSHLEAQLATTQTNLAGVEDKLKALQKAKAKTDSTLEETEQKLLVSEKDRVDLGNAKRKLESELASAREKIDQLEKRVAELEAEVAKKTKELADTAHLLEEEQQKCIRAEREKRELSNQLELLKEELESEQSAVSKLKKEKADLDTTIKSLEAAMEDKASAGAAQADMRAKRESELKDLQKKYQDLSESSERDMTELKKRFTQQLEAKEGEMDALSKTKADLEKRAGQLKDELEQTHGKLEGESKMRAELDKKKKALEQQLAETQSKLQETERKMQEAKDHSARLQSEVDALSKKYDEKDAAFTVSERERKAQATKIEEMTGMYEEETRQKLALQGKLKNTEQQIDEMREQLVERDNEREASDRNMSTLKAQVDELKAKWDSEKRMVEEVENSKKKLQRDVTELQEQLNEANGAKSKLVSTNARLQADMEDMTNELNSARNEVLNAQKKAKKAEAMLLEQKAMVDAAEAERNTAQADASRLGVEVYGLKSKNEELMEMVAQMKKENQNLKAEIEELKSSGDRDASYVANLEKSKRSLETMLEEQKTEMEELEDELQSCEDAKVRLEVSIQALKQQMERDNLEREEKIEDARRGVLRQLRDMEEQLEEERRSRAAAVARAKKLETDLAEIQGSLDDADKQKEEAIKQSKKAAQLAKDYQADADDARAMLSDQQNHFRDVEKKANRLASDNANLSAELEKSERNRKAAEAARDEAMGELDALRAQVGQLSEAKRRLDGELSTLREENEEIQSELDMITDRERKSALELESARHEAALEKETVSKLESRVQQLERHCNELREQAENATADAEKRIKSKLVPLEQKVSTLTAELDNEIKKGTDLANKNKRLDRKAKDTQRMLEDAEKSAAEHKANFDRVNSKIRNLTSQNEELESEVSSLRQKNKRLQNEVNEATELAEQLRSQLTSVQSRVARASRSRRTKNDDIEDVSEPAATEA